MKMGSDSGLSLVQEQALAICPKVSASISMPCSLFIILEVVADYRTRGTTPIQRALMGMSIVDIIASSAWFLSTWAVPEDSGWAFAAGNARTCNYQGFLLQLAIGAPLYNSSLALFYLLMIKMRWSDKQLRKIELWVHGFILSFSIGTSILLLELGQYNHIGAVCWVIGDPADCGNSSFQPSDVPCERGNYAWAWGVALFYGPLWICVIACTISMIVLYLEVRKTHARSLRYSTAIQGMKQSNNRSGADTKKVAIQAILYSLTFLITWMPSTMWSIGHWFNWSHYSLDQAAACAEPLQGLWNFLIFIKSRPRTILKIRAIMSLICPCCVKPLPSKRYGDSRLSFVTGLLRANRSDFLKSSTIVSEREANGVSKPFSAGDADEERDDDRLRSADGIPLGSDLFMEEMPDISESSFCSEVGFASFLVREDTQEEGENNETKESAKEKNKALSTTNKMLGSDNSVTSSASENLFTVPHPMKDLMESDNSSSSDDSSSSNSSDKSNVSESRAGAAHGIGTDSNSNSDCSNNDDYEMSSVDKSTEETASSRLSSDSTNPADEVSRGKEPYEPVTERTDPGRVIRVFVEDMTLREQEYFYFT